MAERIEESLAWLIETASPEDGVARVEEELEIDHAEIHAAVEMVAQANETPPDRFADQCGDLHFAFEWGVRWQREREDG